MIFKTFIDRDITVAINGDANYLAALGLCTYTEILGGLYSGDVVNNLGAHYFPFIKDFFPSEYIKVDANLKLKFPISQGRKEHLTLNAPHQNKPYIVEDIKNMKNLKLFSNFMV